MKIISSKEFEVIRANKDVTDVEYMGYSKGDNSDCFELHFENDESETYTVEYKNLRGLKTEVDNHRKRIDRIKSKLIKEDKELKKIVNSIELVKSIKSYYLFDVITELEKTEVKTRDYIKSLNDDLFYSELDLKKCIKLLETV